MRTFGDLRRCHTHRHLSLLTSPADELSPPGAISRHRRTRLLACNLKKRENICLQRSQPHSRLESSGLRPRYRRLRGGTQACSAAGSCARRASSMWTVSFTTVPHGQQRAISRIAMTISSTSVSPMRLTRALTTPQFKQRQQYGRNEEQQSTNAATRAAATSSSLQPRPGRRAPATTSTSLLSSQAVDHQLGQHRPLCAAIVAAICRSADEQQAPIALRGHPADDVGDHRQVRRDAAR